MTADTRQHDGFDAWNPGIVSDLPREYLPLSTIYSADNVSTPLATALELSDFCGIAPHLLVAFRARRLVVHEILIRVTADLTVPDGFAEADLGVNFRHIAGAILEGHVRPHMDVLDAALDAFAASARDRISAELHRALGRPEPDATVPARRRSLWSLFRRSPHKTAAPVSADEHRDRVVSEWSRRAGHAGSEEERACYAALAQTAAAVARRRGRLMGDVDTLTGIAVTLACNGYGSRLLGRTLEPWFAAAVRAEGFRRLPVQPKPVVFNVKGASAAGKSTLRPAQRRLAERLHLPWEDFALISPDIWRKFLLDYDALGPAHKYAGTLSGLELEIVDRKLDAYMARKGTEGRLTHLVIDRFRFDSFTPESEGDDASRLLTRFGDLIYISFMITPPHMTVERAWHRGLKFGRYKAVDDLLHHNIEAFTGMREVFFTWALRTRKRVHFEFLDNSVEKGERPRTAAYGTNAEMNVLDVKALIDIDRYRKIRIDAHAPAEVYEDGRMQAADNIGFLAACAKRLVAVRFADAASRTVYAGIENGRPVIRDAGLFEQALANPDTAAGLTALGITADADPADPLKLDPDSAHILGAWSSPG